MQQWSTIYPSQEDRCATDELKTQIWAEVMQVGWKIGTARLRSADAQVGG